MEGWPECLPSDVVHVHHAVARTACRSCRINFADLLVLYQFRSDIYMAYHDEHIEEYRLMRNAILDEVTDAAGESPKIPRLQRALQQFDENFDVIGLINFSWDHTVSKHSASSNTA